jgi:hypothetical protein
LTNRSHCTKANGVISDPLPINASIIQGSALGPVSYIINASDLKATVPGNRLHKYADDTYLIVPACNGHTITTELLAIEQWANKNNLKLNLAKSCEMIVTTKRSAKLNDPPLIPGIIRVDSVKILGTVICKNLSVSDHVDNLTHLSGQNLYALKTLKAHGMPLNQLNTVSHATLVSRLLHAAPAWRGFANCNDLARLQAILSKATKWGVMEAPALQIKELYDEADENLFAKVLNNTDHVMYPLLPPQKNNTYNLRSRKHNHILPANDNNMSRNFLHRMLYKDSY